MQIKNDVVPSGAASFCYERLVVVNGLSCKCTHIDVIKSCESNSIRSFYFAFMFSFRLIGQKVCVAFLGL